MIVDAWMQHPTLRFARHDMFASLRRWTPQPLPVHDMFGSNYPMLLPQQALADLDSLGLDEAARTAFLGQTAARLFRIRAPAPA